MQHITQANGQPSGHTIPSGQDPLTHHDPWKKPGIPSNANAITSAQVAQLEASLTKKIEKALQDRKPTRPAEDADITMESDVRVTHLEQQISSLSEGLQKLPANVIQFQQAQQQQNTAFAQQTQGLQTQIEQQGHNMQKVVDQAMEDQMRRIEALFTKDREHAAKVARKGEWPVAFCHNMHIITCKCMWTILLAPILIRVGEAANPRPTEVEHEAAITRPGLTIGAINPTGILKKSQALTTLPCRESQIWGICETHLTSPGIKKFRNELHCTNPKLKFHASAPTPFRSFAPTAIAGTHHKVLGL